MSNVEVIKQINSGYRMECPNNCPKEIYQLMMDTWKVEPKHRPTFIQISQTLDHLWNQYKQQKNQTLNDLQKHQKYLGPSSVDINTDIYDQSPIHSTNITSKNDHYTDNE